MYRNRNEFWHEACFSYLLCRLEIQIIVSVKIQIIAEHTQPRRVGTAAVTNCYIIIAPEYTQAQHKPTGAKSPLVTSQRYLKIKEQR